MKQFFTKTKAGHFIMILLPSVAGWLLIGWLCGLESQMYLIGLPFITVYAFVGSLFCDCDKWI